DGKIMPFKMTAFHPCFVANKYGECRDRGERSSHNSLSVSLKLGRQDNAVFQLKTAFAGRCKPHPPTPSPLRGEGSRAKRDGGEVRGSDLRLILLNGTILSLRHSRLYL